MNTDETPSKTFSNGLWIPALIISVGLVFSIIFSMKTLKGYKQPRPLLIKPSSVNQPDEITASLKRALFPFRQNGLGVQIIHLDDAEIPFQIAGSLVKAFPKMKNNLKFSIYKVGLDDPHDPSKVDCKNTALFNLKRKPKRKWKKKIYFTVCTESQDTFSIFYTSR